MGGWGVKDYGRKMEADVIVWVIGLSPTDSERGWVSKWYRCPKGLSYGHLRRYGKGGYPLILWMIFFYFRERVGGR